MAEYVKQVWEDGVSPVNAERLNHMEEGIANAGGVFNVSFGEENKLDKTYEETKAAYESGKMCFLHIPGNAVLSLVAPMFENGVIVFGETMINQYNSAYRCVELSSDNTVTMGMYQLQTEKIM